MLFVAIIVLSLVLAFPEPAYPLWTSRGSVIACLVAATLLPAVTAWFVRRRAVALLDRIPEDPARGQAVYGWGMHATQALLAACHGAVFLLTTWQALCTELPRVGGWPLVPGLVATAPFLVSLILVWVVVYPAERGVRQIAVELHLFRGKPVRPAQSLGEFLAFNLRHSVLFILVPMMLVLAARDVILMYYREIKAWTGTDYAPDLLLGAAALGVAVITPAIIRVVWLTRRLPDGPLRDQLLALCGKLRVRCREILVWRTGGMLVNAAVVGVVAPLRYVLISDAMLEQLNDSKIEAVFGHEAGHVKHHHILYYLLFGLISGCLLTIFSAYERSIPAEQHDVALVGLAVVLAVKWLVVFRWLARRFERQADVQGVRTLMVAGLPCVRPCHVHGAEPRAEPAANPGGAERAGAPLCVSAAHVYGDMLNEVAALNGVSPDARGWLHPSITTRSLFVQRMARYPEAVRGFEQRTALAKGVILLVAAASVFWAVWKLELWRVVLLLK